MFDESNYKVRPVSQKDTVHVKKLLKDTFKMNDEFLTWKYDSNPDFEPSLGVVIVNSGQVVGCLNWLVKNLKISRSLSVRAALGADLAVHSSHRGQNLAKPLIASENTILEDKNIIMSYGFVDPELVKHVHGPLLGLTEVPTSTTVYKKHFNLSEIQEKVVEINRIAKSDEATKKKLTNSEMTILFNLRGTPPFKIRISPSDVRLEENDQEKADLKIESDLTRSEIIKSKRRTLTLIIALLTRKLKIKGSLRKAIKLYGLSKILGILIV